MERERESKFRKRGWGENKPKVVRRNSSENWGVCFFPRFSAPGVCSESYILIVALSVVDGSGGVFRYFSPIFGITNRIPEINLTIALNHTFPAVDLNLFFFWRRRNARDANGIIVSFTPRVEWRPKK